MTCRDVAHRTSKGALSRNRDLGRVGVALLAGRVQATVVVATIGIDPEGTQWRPLRTWRD